MTVAMPSQDGAPCANLLRRQNRGTEQIERHAVVREAESWIGTPFHHMGRLKGRNGGVDCAYSCAMIYHAALPDRVPAMEFGYYAPGWNMSRKGATGERYLSTVQDIPGVREVEKPHGGDLALFRWGLAWAHGAIVVAWPQIIHADMNAGCRDRRSRRSGAAAAPAEALFQFLVMRPAREALC